MWLLLNCTLTWRHSTRLMVEMLWVSVLAGVAGEFSSPELTFWADSYSVPVPSCVTTVACKRPRSFCQKCRWKVTPKHVYLYTWPDKIRVGWLCCPGIVWEPIRKTSSHTTRQVILGHLLAEPLWTDPSIKKWNWYAQADLHLHTHTHTHTHAHAHTHKLRWRMICQTFPQIRHKWGKNANAKRRKVMTETESIS